MENTGKLVIEGIANDDVAQKVIGFLCANAKNMTPEIASARLKNLPLLLTNRISEVLGTRIANQLCEMGAAAVFIPDVPEPSTEGCLQPEAKPIPTKTEQIPPEIPAQSIQDPALSQPMQSAKPGVNQARKIPPSVNPDSERYNLAKAHKLLVWGIIAGLLSPLSFAEFLFAVPFQLYITYHVTKTLKNNLAMRVLCLLFVLIPVINVIVLLVLKFHASKCLNQTGGLNAGAATQKEKPQHSFWAPAYVAGLAFVCLVMYIPRWIPMLFEEDSSDKIQSGQAAVNKEEHIKAMEAAALEINKQLPQKMVMDNDLSLEKMTFEPDNLFVLHVKNTKYPSTAINKDTFIATMTPKTKDTFCKDFMKYGDSVAFVYSGNDGAEITTITVTPEDCGKKQ